MRQGFFFCCNRYEVYKISFFDICRSRGGGIGLVRVEIVKKRVFRVIICMAIMALFASFLSTNLVIECLLKHIIGNYISVPFQNQTETL